jgi:hypothetical protein
MDRTVAARIGWRHALGGTRRCKFSYYSERRVQFVKLVLILLHVLLPLAHFCSSPFFYLQQTSTDFQQFHCDVCCINLWRYGIPGDIVASDGGCGLPDGNQSHGGTFVDRLAPRPVTR